MSDLTKVGFKRVRAKDHPYLIAAIAGRGKRGKTHMALSADDPIAVFNFDDGFYEILSKFPDKVIHTFDAAIPQKKADCKILKSEFEKAWKIVLADDSINTVVVDTESELWELYRMAEFGQVTKILPEKYTEVNLEYKRTLRMAKYVDKDVIYLQQMKKLYKNRDFTGLYERVGFNGMEFLAQALCTLDRYEEDDEIKFMLTIDESRHNPQLIDLELEDELCDWSVLKETILEED